MNKVKLSTAPNLVLPTNVIICGDSAEILKTFPDNSVSMILTSPPYDSLRKNKDYDDTFDFETIAHELYRVLKPGGSCIWIVGDAVVNSSETLTSFKQAIYFKEKAGFNIWDTMIYKKHSFTFPDKNRYYPVFEYMFWMSKGTPAIFNPIKDRDVKYKGSRGASGRDKDGNRRKGKSVVTNDVGVRHNIWEYVTGKHHTTKDTIAFKHPAIFPDKLAEDLILSFSNEGDIVLDCFAGSSTTGVAAKKLNRQFILIEKSKEYCELGQQRFKNRFSFEVPISYDMIDNSKLDLKDG